MEHPMIREIQTYGYPLHVIADEIVCESCGDDVTDEDVYFDEYHECLCEKCLLRLHKKVEW